jgi:hypothetical protein
VNALLQALAQCAYTEDIVSNLHEVAGSALSIADSTHVASCSTLLHRLREASAAKVV